MELKITLSPEVETVIEKLVSAIEALCNGDVKTPESKKASTKKTTTKKSGTDKKDDDGGGDGDVKKEARGLVRQIFGMGDKHEKAARKKVKSLGGGGLKDLSEVKLKSLAKWCTEYIEKNGDSGEDSDDDDSDSGSDDFFGDE